MKICYWDSELGVQGERDATPVEIAQAALDAAAATAPLIPQSIPRLNARLTLLGHFFPSGTSYWVDIVAFVAAIPGAAGDQARAYFEDAQTWRRDNALVAAWAAARGLTGAEIDALFIAAGDLNV